ncbi:MAG: hypothetical protein ACQETL_19805 [Bacteroidota bacterium]
MGVFLEIIINIGSIIGLVVGLIQLYRWYGDSLIEWIKSSSEYRKKLKIKGLENEINRLSDPEKRITDLFNFIIQSVLALMLITIGIFQAVLIAADAGITLNPMASVLSDFQLFKDSYREVMLFVANALIIVGLVMITSTIFSFQSQAYPQKRIKKLRQKLSEFQ